MAWRGDSHWNQEEHPSDSGWWGWSSGVSLCSSFSWHHPPLWKIKILLPHDIRHSCQTWWWWTTVGRESTPGHKCSNRLVNGNAHWKYDCHTLVLLSWSQRRLGGKTQPSHSDTDYTFGWRLTCHSLWENKQTNKPVSVLKCCSLQFCSSYRVAKRPLWPIYQHYYFY